MTVQDEPAAGTWDAFEAEAMPHVDRLFRLAMWWERDRGEAEDLVQETLVQALQSFHRFTLGTNCRAWLITILQHVRSNRRRAKAPPADGRGSRRPYRRNDPVRPGRAGSPHGRRTARGHPGTAGELPGHHPAVRRRGADLQGDRGRFDDSHRNGHVAAAPRREHCCGNSWHRPVSAASFRTSVGRRRIEGNHGVPRGSSVRGSHSSASSCSSKRRGRLVAHLDRCPACRAEIDGLRRVRGAIMRGVRRRR